MQQWSREAADEVIGSKYTFGPKFQWQICLKSQSSTNIEKVAMFAFNNSILSWCRDTRTLKQDTKVKKNVFLEVNYMPLSL